MKTQTQLMNLSDLLPPGFVPPPPSAMQLVLARRAQLSEPFRHRGQIQRKPLDVCRFEHAQYLVGYCGFTAEAAHRDAMETFQA